MRKIVEIIRCSECPWHCHGHCLNPSSGYIRPAIKEETGFVRAFPIWCPLLNAEEEERPPDPDDLEQRIERLEELVIEMAQGMDAMAITNTSGQAEARYQMSNRLARAASIIEAERK